MVTAVAGRRRLGAGAQAGSLGGEVAVVVSLGKTPTQAQAVAIVGLLGALGPSSATFAFIIAAVATQAGAPAATFTPALATPPSLRNAPFALPAAAPAAAAASSSPAVGAGVGGVVAAVALAVGVWTVRSFRKHKKLPCARDRGMEERRKKLYAQAHAEDRAELDEIRRAISTTANPIAASGAAQGAGGGTGGARASGALMVRAISTRNSELERELAALKAALAAKAEAQPAQAQGGDRPAAGAAGSEPGSEPGDKPARPSAAPARFSAAPTRFSAPLPEEDDM